MAADIIARGMAAKTAAELDSFEQETAAALARKADLENGKVPAEQLPSYVDDVSEYASVSAFPAEGETGKIYVALDTGYTYRWSGSTYIQIGGQDLSDYYTKSEEDALLGNKLNRTNFRYTLWNSEYNAESGYSAGDITYYDDYLYEAKVNISAPAGEFDYSKWQNITLETLLYKKLDKDNFKYVLWNNIYNTEYGYAIGDIVYYENYLYEATAVIPAPAGNFDYSKWQSVSLETLLFRKQDVISDLPTIRAGAALGATALQPSDIGELGSADVIAAWYGVDPVLENNSWAIIRMICEAGLASQFWSIGDEKTVVGGDGQSRKVKIVDMAGLYGKHVVFQFMDLTNTTYVFSGQNWNEYSSSNMNAYLSDGGAIQIDLLDDSLSAQLTDTTVKVARSGTNSNLIEVTKKLFLPAERELWTTRTNSVEAEFNALATFEYWQAYTANADHVLKNPADDTAQKWWLRSPNSGSSTDVCLVDSDGSASKTYSSAKRRVSACFAF